jgi:hypothetical protein
MCRIAGEKVGELPMALKRDVVSNSSVWWRPMLSVPYGLPSETNALRERNGSSSLRPVSNLEAQEGLERDSGFQPPSKP